MQIAASYEQVIGRKTPEMLAIAIAKDAQGKFNPITLGWVMRTSHQPPMLAISVGLTRHSLEAIRGAREFVVSFPSATMGKDALYHGSHSGSAEDKLAACGTKTQPATKIDCVLLADAVANFECQLESEVTTGDHVIFVGRVVASHMNKDAAAQCLYLLPGDRLGGVAAEGS